jgi:hypothetical protein
MYTDGKVKTVYFPSKEQFLMFVQSEGDHLVEWTEVVIPD